MFTFDPADYAGEYAAKGFVHVRGGLAPDYLAQGLDLPGGNQLTEALDAFRPAGSVLEFACGPGVWTGQLLRHATDVTAVDASPEMLALAAARIRRGGATPIRVVRPMQTQSVVVRHTHPVSGLALHSLVPGVHRNPIRPTAPSEINASPQAPRRRAT